MEVASESSYAVKRPMDLPDEYNDNLVDETGNKLSKRYILPPHPIQHNEAVSSSQI